MTQPDASQKHSKSKDSQGKRQGLRGLVLAVILLMVASGVWLWKERKLAPSAGAVVGGAPGAALKQAPEFALPDAKGRMVSLSEFRGKAVFVHFWATWCPPCVREVPEFLEFARSQAGKPVQFIAVSLDSSWGDAHRILPESKLPANVVSVLDTESRVADAFGSFQFPETYLLAADHGIFAKFVGPQAWSSEPILASLARAMPATR